MLLCLLGKGTFLLPSPSPGSRSLLGPEDPQVGGRALLRKLTGIYQKTGITSQKTWILILILLSHLSSGAPSGHFCSGFPISNLYEIFSCPVHDTHPPQVLYIYIYIYIYTLSFLEIFWLRICTYGSALLIDTETVLVCEFCSLRLNIRVTIIKVLNCSKFLDKLCCSVCAMRLRFL